LNVDTRSQHARRLAAALEPCIGQVYFAPEAHAEYESLGFAASPGAFGGVAMPDGPAYFTSRGSLMGQVAPHVVAAAFAVFNPDAVVPSVQYGWSLTDAPTIFAARRRGAVAQLTRVLGASPDAIARANDLLERAVDSLRPEGRALFAGLRTQWDNPPDALTRFFHLGDMLREYRGDSHTAAWISAGVDATEIGLLTELYIGLPLRTYSRTRAWSDEQFDAATERLQSRGWLDADSGFTPAGREARESIEVATDAQLGPALDALGDDLEELLALLTPWGSAVKDAHGYVNGAGDLWPGAAS
jgi:hypothetical protein